LNGHYEKCIDKIAIENLQYEENSIPTETYFYNNYKNNTKEEKNSPYMKKQSEFKDEDIGNIF